MDKYLQLLKEKRLNAQADLETISRKKVHDVAYVRLALIEQINTYTDCIELYKSMQQAYNCLEEKYKIEQEAKSQLKGDLYMADCDYKVLKQENAELKCKSEMILDIGERYKAMLDKTLKENEKLKKALRMYYEKCDFVYDNKRQMWKFDNIEYWTQEEYELLKGLENE